MTRVQRRNFLPAVIVDLVLWISCGLIVFLLDPDKDSFLFIGSFRLTIYPNIILFFVIFGLSLTITLALLFGNTRRGFFVSLLFILILLLRLLGIAHWWTILPLVVALLVSEVLSARRKQEII